MAFSTSADKDMNSGIYVKKVKNFSFLSFPWVGNF